MARAPGARLRAVRRTARRHRCRRARARRDPPRHRPARALPHAVGNGLCDWVWLSAGLDEPAREPWQVWPLGFDPVVYQVWTVTQREPLRVGVPAGSIWLDIDAAYDDAAMIETLHALIPPTP